MEHLLLAPLGKSPGTVLSLLDWLNNPDDWVHAARSLPRVTDLWVVTTANQWILDHSVKPLEGELRRALATNPKVADGLNWRIFIAECVQDIVSTGHAMQMAEVLYRLVLYGEGWRNEPGKSRRFSVSITGGRKTMSADLHQAATFFEVDSVLQMVFAGEDDERPDRLDVIREKRQLHYPVITSAERSPWRRLLDKPWSDRHRGLPLIAENFKLRDWERRDLPRVYTGPEDPEMPMLISGLKTIASDVKTFADRALTCGVGPHFLTHDLRGLVDDLISNPPQKEEAELDIRLTALSEYLVGLSAVIDEDAPNQSEKQIRFEALPTLCRQGLVIALGRSIATEPDGCSTWRLNLSDGDLSIAWKGWDQHRHCVVGGLTGQSLSLILRNFLANAWKHGKVHDSVVVELALETVPEGLSLICRNPVPLDRVKDDAFRALVRGDGTMPRLLQPFLSVPSPDERKRNRKAGDGLGLFTVARTVERTNGAVELVGPRLEPWPDEGQSVDFVVGLLFKNVIGG